MADDVLRTLSHAYDWRAEQPLRWPVTTEVGPGLAGVIAAETRVMWLDPSSGALAYRGIPIERLAPAADFEWVTHLLVTGHTGDDQPDDFGSFRDSMRAARALPDDVHRMLRQLDPATHPTRMLRAGLSALGCHELDVADDLAGERHWRELRIVGQVAAVVEDLIRHRAGRQPVTALPGSTLAEGVLTAMLDRPPTAAETRALDLLWLLYAAHGLDAPTFTAMIVASCRADPYATVVSGLSALRGPRMGGAAERVLDQLLPIDDPATADTWVRTTLAGGGRIAGFGHGVYRMPDPRVVILRKEVAELARATGRQRLYEVARAVEDAATRALAPKGVHVNINFYGAVLFHLLGAEPALTPCLVAVGRMAGMVALIREALDTMRLFRPLDRYVGAPERRIVPAEERR